MISNSDRKARILFILRALLSASFVLDGAVDVNCTKEMVCTSGYTATVRPAVGYTNLLKEVQLGVSGKDTEHSYEEDHFIPLELCGCPKCVDNLWPQPWPEARKKDAEETHLHRLVCQGKMTLWNAQAQIRRDWKIQH